MPGTEWGRKDLLKEGMVSSVLPVRVLRAPGGALSKARLGVQKNKVSFIN